jgi:nucleotide-binding universal stress UspA family protein
MFKNILLAYDGSEHSDHALELAATLAKTNDGRITIVYAFEPIPIWAGYPEMAMSLPSLETRLTTGEAILDQAQQRLNDLGVQAVEQDILEGPPADAIIHATTVLQPDVVVMGSRGLGAVKGLLLGSVSERVIGAVACPVLVTR